MTASLTHHRLLMVCVVAVMAACGGPDGVGDDPWTWAADDGTRFSELREQCLDWQESLLAHHFRSEMSNGPGHSALFDAPSELAEQLSDSQRNCRTLDEQWPGNRSQDAIFDWLALIARTRGHVHREPEALLSIRTAGSPRVSALAELFLFDWTITILVFERPEAHHDSRAMALTLRFFFEIDLGESTRLDDPIVLLALSEEVPGFADDLRNVPYQMAGWAALAGVLRYLAGDLHRLRFCHRNGPFADSLEQLVETATAEEASNGHSSRSSAYFEAHRDHYVSRCLPGWPDGT